MKADLATLVAITAHTPVWVWALYALLLFLGLQRTRDSVLPLWRVLILPLVVAALAISSFLGAGPGAVPSMAAGLLIGGALGWNLEPVGSSRRLAGGTLWLRGEWWSFVQIVVVLILRYVTNVVAAVDPGLSAHPTWYLGTLFVSAALSAVFLGRTAARVRVYLAATPASEAADAR